MQTQVRHSAFRQAQAVSARLLIWLQSPHGIAPSAIVRAFAVLARLTEALPVDLETICYVRNRLPSTQSLWQQGDRHTAVYQLRELHRKLAQLADAAQ